MPSGKRQAQGESPGTSHIEIGGRIIAVRRVAGAVRTGAPVLVFLHEGLGCIGMWKDFPDALSEATGCPALIYDRFGHGGSDGETAPRGTDFFEYEAHTVLPALLKACGVGDAILVGHSDGGTIALLYAGQTQVRGVITEAAHVFVEPESLAGVETAKTAWRDEGFRARLARYHGDGTASMFAAWAEMWSADWFRDWNIEAALPAVTCPLLVIQGAADEYGTAAQVEAILHHVSGPAESLLVQACGHAPHVQAREVVLAAMAAFVRSLMR